jgi:hypothetical protein
VVSDGVGRFDESLCQDLTCCTHYSSAVPCPGHGAWMPPAGLALPRLVELVCSDKVRPFDMRERWSHPRGVQSNGPTVWTDRTYVRAEQRQVDAGKLRRAWANKQEEEAAAHERRIGELMRRQQVLIPITVTYFKWLTQRPVRALDRDRDPFWAMGVPVLVDGEPAAVICPVASRVGRGVREMLAELVVVVASPM